MVITDVPIYLVESASLLLTYEVGEKMATLTPSLPVLSAPFCTYFIYRLSIKFVEDRTGLR